MIEISYQQYKLTILEDDQYTIESADNLRGYDNVYFDNTLSRYQVTAKLAILVNFNNEEITSAILCDIGPYAGLNERTFLIEDEHLYICFTDDLYCFNIPNLALIWKKRVDYCVNHGVQKIQNDLLVHGEFEIIRITKLGEIKWRFGGHDIWVNNDGHQEVTILSKSIKLVDFESNCYYIGFDGNTISQKRQGPPTAIIYSYDKIIGTAELEVGDFSMGGLYGDFTPSQTYLTQIQKHAQEFLNKNGQNLKEWQGLRFNIQLENGLFLFPVGGITIEDSEELPEISKRIELAGVDTRIIEDFIIENPPKAFVEYPWEPLSIDQKLDFEDKMYKEIHSSGSLSGYFRKYSSNNFLKEATVSALCINIYASEVLFEIQSKTTDQQFALIDFKRSDLDKISLSSDIILFHDFDEFKYLKMYPDRNQWEE